MKRLLGAAALALVIASGASGATGTDPGVTSTQIVLGGTAAISGPLGAYYAPVAAGAAAYLEYVNARGGVNGRKIVYKVVDDAYDPSKTVEATRELIQQEHVFAIFNSIGTEHTLAVRALLNGAQIPQLFVGTGARSVGRDASKYPWTMGYLPSFFGEGRAYGQYIGAHQKGAKVGVLYEDDDYGRDLLDGLRAGLGKKGRIVSAQSYALTDADVNSQVARLKAAGANTFAVFALPKQAIQAFLQAHKLGWKPRTFMSSVSIDPFVMDVITKSTSKATAEGTISMAFLKVATDPVIKNDKGVKLYFSVMKNYCHGCDANALAHIYGMATAYTMVDALKKAGKNLTRKGLLTAATHLREGTNPFLQPGLVVQTGPRDYWPLEKMRLFRYHSGRWQPAGRQLIAVRP
jgi:ABC-type branched-subunit amino acid transport system substrate-binding protein